MGRKSVLTCVSIMLVLALAGNAQAALWWCGTSGDWADPVTWSIYGSGMPDATTSDGQAFIFNGATVDVTEDGWAAPSMEVGYAQNWSPTSDPGYAVTGGTLNIASGVTWTQRGGEFSIGHMGGKGILNVDGTVVSNGTLRMATWNAYSSGVINVNNGGYFTGLSANIGEAGSASINLNGDGSMLLVGTINLYNGGGHIDIEAGQLKVMDSLATIQGYIANGWITGYNGTGTVNAVSEGDFTVVTAVPEPVTMVLLGVGSLLLRRRSA